MAADAASSATAVVGIDGRLAGLGGGAGSPNKSLAPPPPGSPNKVALEAGAGGASTGGAGAGAGGGADGRETEESSMWCDGAKAFFVGAFFFF